jgi:hypothetical protein
MEFAAGVLDKVSPALDAVTEALSRIDAAAIGQKFADAFTGGVSAMKGFQAAVDAFKTGNIEGALSLLWDSIKLQAKMTADEIYRNLIAAFQTAGTFIAEIFSPSGALLSTIVSSFEMLGKKMASGIQRDLAGVMESLPMGIGDAAALALNKMANDSNTAANKISDSLVGAGGRIADQFIKAGAALPETFSEKYSTIPPLFTDLNEQAAALAAKQAEIAAKANEAAGAIGKKKISEEEAAEEAKKYFQQYQDGMAAIDEQNAKKTESIARQIALNEAIAGGNVEEQKRIEALIESDKRTEEIAKKTAEIVKELGLGEKEAETLATRFVDSEIAARGAGDQIKTVGELIAAANKEEMDNPAKTLKERTDEARESLKDMKEFIGEDLNRMNLESIIRKLGLDVPALAGPEEKLKAIEEAIQKISGADPADITPDVDLVGVNDRLEKVKEYLKNAGKEKPDVTPQVDQSAVETAVKKAKETIDAELKSPVDVNLDAGKAIGKIREDLKEQIDVAIQSSKGTEHLSSIDTLVGKIESLVNKISEKLPMQALAY